MTDYVKRDWNQLKRLYDTAEKAQSFTSLIPYPVLLYSWQGKHRRDVMKIAAIASHKLGKHKWCNKEEGLCEKIQLLIEKAGVAEI